MSNSKAKEYSVIVVLRMLLFVPIKEV